VPPVGTCLDLIVCGPGPTLPRGPTPSEVIQNPGSLVAMDLGVTELGLPGYPGMSSPPVKWMQVEGSAELVCSCVVAAGRLLQEAMAMVGQDILLPIWVSKSGRKIYLSFYSSLQVS
jgi:hypothetical protein